MSGGWLLLKGLPSWGAHFDYRISVQSGNTWFNAQYGIEVFLLGG